MGRKKKVESLEPAKSDNKCRYCGAEIEPGHRCACKESRNEYAKQLFEEHYGKRRRNTDD